MRIVAANCYLFNVDVSQWQLVGNSFLLLLKFFWPQLFHVQTVIAAALEPLAPPSNSILRKNSFLRDLI